MDSKLYNRFRDLIAMTDTRYLRYMYGVLPWDNRMTALIGARGVGKTTLILQYIKRELPLEKTVYVTADDMYFTSHHLLDFAEDFYKSGGEHLFIDEIHKYLGWSQELKLIYDYLPKLKVFITGSSILDIYKGSADLSRRILIYQMRGMSFREYLGMNLGIDLPAATLDDITNHRVETPGLDRPLMHFRDYLKTGYYPFSGSVGYMERLNQVVNMTLETDIPTYSKMTPSTAMKLKHLMQIVADSVPFKPNYSKIAELVFVDRSDLTSYMVYLERAGLVLQLRDKTGGPRRLGKVEKTYIENTNLSYALSSRTPDTGNLRETFFLNQMSVNHSVMSSKKSDFEIEGMTFEVGGKGKGQSQLKGDANGFIVKDDIEYGYGNVIPLWHFGLNY